MKKVIFIAFAFISCSEIEQPIDSKIIIGCVCKDGTTQIYRPDLIKEINRITQFPCSANGGIKEYIYK
jgi:phosphoribosylformimino-5-aminoimidazole carboxamide ribonucleotide (ProFAR) isomerase